MKNTILLLASLCALFGFTACDLDITPDTAITGPDAARLKYVRGMRAGVYNDMTSLASPAYTINDEYQSDLYVQTTNSGNRGGFFFRWEIYEDDQDIRGQWHGYYAMIANINYALNKCAETAVSSDAAREEIALYVAEMHFFRAYLFDQLALHFCKAYDPATAASTPGIPCPKSYAPGASLGRGTLAATYAAILEDLKVAEAGITTPGAADSPYLTVDAVTAFKARIALQMKDYGNAARYASSLYAKYPLAASKQALGEMWSADTSTETITQFLVTPTTLSLLGGAVSDFTAGTWEEANGDYLYAPSDVPTQTVADLFVEGGLALRQLRGDLPHAELRHGPADDQAAGQRLAAHDSDAAQLRQHAQDVPRGRDVPDRGRSPLPRQRRCRHAPQRPAPQPRTGSRHGNRRCAAAGDQERMGARIHRRRVPHGLPEALGRRLHAR